MRFFELLRLFFGQFLPQMFAGTPEFDAMLGLNKVEVPSTRKLVDLLLSRRGDVVVGN